MNNRSPNREQVKLLYSLSHRRGWDQATLNSVLLKKFNAVMPYSLTQDQMVAFISDLQKQVDEKTKKAKRENKRFKIKLISIAISLILIVLLNASHIVRYIFTDEETRKLDFGLLSSIFLILIGLLLVCLYFIWEKHDELTTLKYIIAGLFKKEDAIRYFRFTEEDIKELYYDVLGGDNDKEEDKASIVWDNLHKEDDSKESI